MWAGALRAKPCGGRNVQREMGRGEDDTMEGVGCYFGRCQAQGERNKYPTPYKLMWSSSCPHKLF